MKDPTLAFSLLQDSRARLADALAAAAVARRSVVQSPVHLLTACEFTATSDAALRA
jgi:hypothetical protein